MAAALTAIFLIFDIRNFDTQGTIDWRYWALGSFALFCALVYWREIERNAHARPNLIIVASSAGFDDTERVKHVVSEAFLIVRNEPKRRVADATARQVLVRLKYFWEDRPINYPPRYIEAWWSDDLKSLAPGPVIITDPLHRADLDVNGGAKRIPLAWRYANINSIPRDDNAPVIWMGFPEEAYEKTYCIFGTFDRSFALRRSMPSDAKVHVLLTGENIEEEWCVELYEDKGSLRTRGLSRVKRMRF
jgi:hypothetical protein